MLDVKLVINVVNIFLLYTFCYFLIYWLTDIFIYSLIYFNLINYLLILIKRSIDHKWYMPKLPESRDPWNLRAPVWKHQGPSVTLSTFLFLCQCKRNSLWAMTIAMMTMITMIIGPFMPGPTPTDIKRMGPSSEILNRTLRATEVRFCGHSLYFLHLYKEVHKFYNRLLAVCFSFDI